MFTLEQFTLEGTTQETGEAIALRRKMARRLEEFTAMGMTYHAVLVNPHGQVCATA